MKSAGKRAGTTVAGLTQGRFESLGLPLEEAGGEIFREPEFEAEGGGFDGFEIHFDRGSLGDRGGPGGFAAGPRSGSRR